MKYPAIIIQHPHQRQASATIVESAGDLAVKFDRNDWNFDYSRWESADDIRECFGDESEMPDFIRDYLNGGGAFPAVEHRGYGFEEITPEAEATPYDEALINYVRGDLSGLSVIDSPEAWASWTPPTHNGGRTVATEAARELGWEPAEVEAE